MSEPEPSHAGAKVVFEVLSPPHVFEYDTYTEAVEAMEYVRNDGRPARIVRHTTVITREDVTPA